MRSSAALEIYQVSKNKQKNPFNIIFDDSWQLEIYDRKPVLQTGSMESERHGYLRGVSTIRVELRSVFVGG